MVGMKSVRCSSGAAKKKSKSARSLTFPGIDAKVLGPFPDVS